MIVDKIQSDKGKFGEMTKILTEEIFCPTKLTSDKVFKNVKIRYINQLAPVFIFLFISGAAVLWKTSCTHISSFLVTLPQNVPLCLNVIQNGTQRPLF